VKILNKKVGIASLLTVIMITWLFVGLNFRASAQPPVDVYVQPPNQEVILGGMFDVDIFADYLEPEPLDGFEILVYYDPALINALAVYEGPAIPVGDYPFLSFLIDNNIGTVSLMDTPPNGIWLALPNPLVTIEFVCVGIGTTPINIDPASLFWDWQAIPVPIIPHDGNIGQNYPTAHTYIDPPTITVPICTPFTRNVNVQGVTNLWMYQLTLSYDTASVDAVDIVPGGFLPSPIVLTKIIDDPNGKIYFDVQSGDPTGTSGDGTLAVVTFHCTGAAQSLLTITSAWYYDPQGFLIPTTTADGTIIQFAYWEPIKLQHLVEWPYNYALVDIPFVPPGSPEGYLEVRTHLEAKGYLFDDPATGVAYEIHGKFDVGGEYGEFDGTVTSWWSSNTLEDGTRACMLSAEMSDGTSMAMGFVTNVLPPEQIPEVDPYIIYNAEPYFFIDFYWWAWNPIGRIIRWPYWWHDSHNHPNWFWGPYWWWRTLTKSYFLGLPWPAPINWVWWRPWWGWWWHWVYWRHWYWWSTYFPYDP